jgi:NAD(P)-dependent dehydrogenase (short-subunit alcohol dehydrogenase family)
VTADLDWPPYWQDLMTVTSSRSARWTAAYIGDQRGRTVVVTGANTGIGLETAAALAEHGAGVVLACRDSSKAEAAATRITEAVPGAFVEVVGLDLASLASVRQAADQIRSRYERLDVLINNAGMMVPRFGRTQDGFELQIGTNHLGHFALTGLLLDRLTGTPGSRIITVSSFAHLQGHIDLDDLHFRQRSYRPTAAYAQSKLANLMFAYELQRRLTAIDAQTISVAAHPGAVRTDLQRYLAGPIKIIGNAMMILRGQSDARMGALATLRAATDPAACGGEYYGPERFQGWAGHPVRVDSSARSHDADTQQRLWAESERLTGVTYQFAAARPKAASDVFFRGTPPGTALPDKLRRWLR